MNSERDRLWIHGLVHTEWARPDNLKRQSSWEILISALLTRKALKRKIFMSFIICYLRWDFYLSFSLSYHLENVWPKVKIFGERIKLQKHTVFWLFADWCSDEWSAVTSFLLIIILKSHYNSWTTADIFNRGADVRTLKIPVRLREDWDWLVSFSYPFVEVVELNW